MEDIIKPKLNYWIVGINLIMVIVYNVLSRLADPKEGWGAVMFFVAAHVFVCFVAGMVCVFSNQYRRQSGLWFLSMLLVLVLGFSTCVAVFTIRI